jgi:flagellar hook assembly protein FlgD
VKITVRNVNGQTVWSRTEANAVNEGEYRTEWDLTDMRGRRVPDGIYIYSAEVTADGSKRTVRSRKLLVLAP